MNPWLLKRRTQSDHLLTHCFISCLDFRMQLVEPSLDLGQTCFQTCIHHTSNQCQMWLHRFYKSMREQGVKNNNQQSTENKKNSPRTLKNWKQASWTQDAPSERGIASKEMRCLVPWQFKALTIVVAYTQQSDGHLGKTNEPIAVANQPRPRPNFKVDMIFVIHTGKVSWIDFLLPGQILG